MAVPGLTGGGRFADDTGDADPQLRAALQEFADTGALAGVWRRLPQARLLVALAASGAEGPGSPAEIALLTLSSAPGAPPGAPTVLPAFTCLATLTGFAPSARPVPVPARDALQAALADGHHGLLLDPGGPVPLLVDPDELRQLLDDPLALAGDPGADRAHPSPTGERTGPAQHRDRAHDLARRVAPALARAGVERAVVTPGALAPGAEGPGWHLTVLAPRSARRAARLARAVAAALPQVLDEPVGLRWLTEPQWEDLARQPGTVEVVLGPR